MFNMKEYMIYDVCFILLFSWNLLVKAILCTNGKSIFNNKWSISAKAKLHNESSSIFFFWNKI